MSQDAGSPPVTPVARVHTEQQRDDEDDQPGAAAEGDRAAVPTATALLLTVTSVADLVFFGRLPEAARGRVLPTRVAPAVAVLGLLVCAWLVLSNFTPVTGGSVGVSTVLASIPVAAFALGCVLGGRHPLEETSV